MPLDTVSASARAELVAVNVEIAVVTADRDAALQAVERFERPAGEVQIARAEYAASKQAYDAQVVSWYEGGCIGDRPSAPLELLRLEHQIGDLTRNLGAVESALEAARSALDEQNRILGALAARKQSATYRVIVEVCREHLQRRCVPAMIASLMELSIPQALAAELGGIGVRDPDAMSAARTIEQLIVETRQRVAVRGDQHQARDFISALTQDPHAQLPAPHQGDIEIVELEPRTIKPLEDYSRFINRGEPEAAEPDPFVPAWPDPLWDSAEGDVADRAAAAASEGEEPNTANSPLPTEPVPGPVFGPAPDMTLPAWLDTGGSGFRPPLVGR
jgi:hypothetical protein